MGKTILTTTQSFVLEQVRKDRDLAHSFFLSGGTALSEFYLHHRLSEDIDLFSSIEIDFVLLEKFVANLSKKLKGTYEKTTRTGFYRCSISGSFGLLKIDFVHQIFSQLEHHKNINNLQVSSIWDILVDKLYTIFHRLNARDFVDLYFGIRKVDCDIDQLWNGLEEKYQATFDKMSLLSRLPLVQDATDYPKMLVPFYPKKMEDFFLKITKDMEGEIFEG